jgi:putative hemolysin
LEGKRKKVSWLIAKLLLLFVLLLLSGFFSGSETALIGIGKIRARALLKRGVKGAETIDKLVSEPETTLTTVLIGNNIVNVAASVIAASIAIDLFGSTYGEAIAIGVMTLLILTFAEIMPKTIAGGKDFYSHFQALGDFGFRFPTVCKSCFRDYRCF